MVLRMTKTVPIARGATVAHHQAQPDAAHDTEPTPRCPDRSRAPASAPRRRQAGRCGAPTRAGISLETHRPRWRPTRSHWRRTALAAGIRGPAATDDAHGCD